MTKLDRLRWLLANTKVEEDIPAIAELVRAEELREVKAFMESRAQGKDVVRSAIGHSVDGDDMQWTVNCPECNREYKCEGYFEGTDIVTCKCGCVFRTERVYFEDGSFIS